MDNRICTCPAPLCADDTTTPCLHCGGVVRKRREGRTGTHPQRARRRTQPIKTDFTEAFRELGKYEVRKRNDCKGFGVYILGTSINVATISKGAHGFMTAMRHVCETLATRDRRKAKLAASHARKREREAAVAEAVKAAEGPYLT